MLTDLELRNVDCGSSEKELVLALAAMDRLRTCLLQLSGQRVTFDTLSALGMHRHLESLTLISVDVIGGGVEQEEKKRLFAEAAGGEEEEEEKEEEGKRRKARGKTSRSGTPKDRAEAHTQPAHAAFGVAGHFDRLSRLSLENCGIEQLPTLLVFSLGKLASLQILALSSLRPRGGATENSIKAAAEAAADGSLRASASASAFTPQSSSIFFPALNTFSFARCDWLPAGLVALVRHAPQLRSAAISGCIKNPVAAVSSSVAVLRIVNASVVQTFPVFTEKCVNLICVELSEALVVPGGLSKEQWRSFGLLPALEVLIADANRFVGPHVGELRHCCKLRKLSLCQTEDPQLPESWKDGGGLCLCPSLQVINLSGSSGLSDIRGLRLSKTIRRIDVSGCWDPEDFSAAMVDGIETMQQLELLRVGSEQKTNAAAQVCSC